MWNTLLSRCIQLMRGGGAWGHGGLLDEQRSGTGGTGGNRGEDTYAAYVSVVPLSPLRRCSRRLSVWKGVQPSVVQPRRSAVGETSITPVFARHLVTGIQHHLKDCFGPAQTRVGQHDGPALAPRVGNQPLLLKAIHR